MNHLGIGIGLRRQHYGLSVSEFKDIDWLEIISENFLTFGGQPERVLKEFGEQLPIVPHGLSLSLGSADAPSREYMSSLKRLIAELKSPWFSDHLCLSGVHGYHFFDLIPILRTSEVLANMVEKCARIQDYMKIPFAVENISYYTQSSHHEMSEAEFIAELLQRTGCYLLLDINNVYVNSQNLDFDPQAYLKSLPQKKIIQLHLAGHDDTGERLIDTHGAPVPTPVWELYRWFLKERGAPVSTLIEWDHRIPPLQTLKQQVQLARQIQDEVLGVSHECPRV